MFGLVEGGVQGAIKDSEYQELRIILFVCLQIYKIFRL